MTLPLCVRVRADDERSKDALEKDGWREIEQLVVLERRGLPATWQDSGGNILVSPDTQFGHHGDEVARSVCAGRQGRLWRDPQISPQEALEAYTDWVTRCWMAPDTIRWLATWCGQPAGFLMIRWMPPTYRIEFFAVTPEMRGRGIGRALLVQAMTSLDGTLRAGTQHDNAAAIRLYLTSGFKIVERWSTWHK